MTRDRDTIESYENFGNLVMSWANEQINLNAKSLVAVDMCAFRAELTPSATGKDHGPIRVCYAAKVTIA
jgi:hypothetical protein